MLRGRAQPRAVLHRDEVADRVEVEDQIGRRDRQPRAVGLRGLLDPADLEAAVGELDLGEGQATCTRWQSDELLVDRDHDAGELLEVDPGVGRRRLEVERVDAFDLVQPRRPTLKTGDSVRHTTFGEGVVMECVATSGDHEVTVEFANGVGVKKLLLSYAPLELVAG